MKYHTRKDVSRLVIVNTELILVVDGLLLPIRLSMVNDVLDLRWWWWWWAIGRPMEGNGAGLRCICGGGTRIGRGGGNKGKPRLFADEADDDEDEPGINGNGIGGNDGTPLRDPWWKQAEWCGCWWWWWWWFKRLKRLRRRRNEPLSNMFSLAGSNVQ